MLDNYSEYDDGYGKVEPYGEGRSERSDSILENFNALGERVESSGPQPNLLLDL